MWRQYCKPCHGRRSYLSRKKRLPAYREQLAQRRETDVAFQAYEVWKRTRTRAAARGVEFDLSRQRVQSAMEAGYCEVTGLRFSRTGPFSASIDRINPNIGYLEANSQVVCWIYNRAKGDGSHADVVKMVEALNAIGFAAAA